MPGQHSQDQPAHRASLLRDADSELVAAVEHMRRKLKLGRPTADIVNDIKATMRTPLPRYNFTVLQALCEHHRAKVFNQDAAEMFPHARKEFGCAIKDFAAAIEGEMPNRRARKLADNAWKWDHAADRRVRQGSAQPYKGRPEIYDRDAVWAFADSIARAAGHERFRLGRHGDVTITEKDDKGGPMFRVLVASVRWAMIAAWQTTAPPGTARPAVKPEGILTVIKRGRNEETD